MEKRIEKTEEIDIVIYKSKDGLIQLDVQLEENNVWLTQQQLALLFGRDRTVILRHIQNIIIDKELDESSNVQKMHNKGTNKPTNLYSLDMIISTGYRVKSKQGTEFRIWATKIIKQHLVNGYTANAKRLEQLQKSLKLVADISKRKDLSANEATALLQTVSEYAFALDLLDDYDHQRVEIGNTSKRTAKPVTYDEAIKLIDQMRIKFGDSAVFGIEKDKSLHSSLETIMQSFDGHDLYPSVEEKAANLLYFLVKNHSFVDGNKRIAAAVFLRFAEKNELIYDEDGHKRIANNALVAMTLMIAESRTKEKKMITAMLTNLIIGK